MITAKEISKKSDESILYHYKDLQDTLEIQEKYAREGYKYLPKLEQYRDEYLLYGAEMKKRGLSITV